VFEVFFKKTNKTVYKVPNSRYSSLRNTNTNNGKYKMEKRRIKQNVYGNWVGYEGRARTEEFGDHANSESDAREWLSTGKVDCRSSYNA